MTKTKPKPRAMIGKVPVCKKHNLKRIHILGCKKCVEEADMSREGLLSLVIAKLSDSLQRDIDKIYNQAVGDEEPCE